VFFTLGQGCSDGFTCFFLDLVGVLIIHCLFQKLFKAIILEGRHSGLHSSLGYLSSLEMEIKLKGIMNKAA